ncbi:glutathione S-transferase family protein [Haliangium sp.]|uniref:glutathione S-transferase family protein n=1 Tax=Haliangium sp. TaxID=2663208 RepID=UPI003D120D1A
MELITVPLSHYCERARWALDHAGLDYTEAHHLQMFHRRAVRPAGGRGTVPVLFTPDVGALTDSADIVRFADQRSAPGRRLYPDDPAVRAEVEELERTFAGDYGVETRRLVYHQWFPHRTLLLRYNAGRAPRGQRLALRLAYPLARRVVTRYYRINPATVARGRALIEATLDQVSERLGDGRSYLCGDTFTAADLTFAAMSAILFWPSSYGVPVPAVEEMPARLRADVEAWRAHPAIAFAAGLYRDHRGRARRA